MLYNEDDLKDIPFLVLGNKIDRIESKFDKSSFEEHLGLRALRAKEGGDTSSSRRVACFMSSVVRKAGYGSGINLVRRFRSLIYSIDYCRSEMVREYFARGFRYLDQKGSHYRDGILPINFYFATIPSFTIYIKNIITIINMLKKLFTLLL